MNSITIIEKIDPNNKQCKKERVFFTIGNMQENEVTSKIIEVLRASEEVIKGKTLYKYDGVEVIISDKDIPIVVRRLVEENIDIYSIYKKYNSTK